MAVASRKHQRPKKVTGLSHLIHRCLQSRTSVFVCITGCIICLIISFLIHVTIYCSNGCGPPVKSRGPYITYFPRTVRENDVDTSSKLILLWTHYFGDVTWGVSHSSTLFDQCPVKKCLLTNDKSKLLESDAVLFHSRAVWNYFLGINMPSHHPTHQVWVLHDFEPPPNVYLNMAAYNNVFNWTMTYREDSDVQTPYGYMRRIDDESVSWKTETDPVLLAAGRSTGHGPKLTKEVTVGPHNYYREKTKFMAWTASNCVAQSRRQRIVKQLQKYLEIDTFGACGTNKLKCTSLKCQEELGAYRFYIVFENSFCKDYASEKFFNALDRSQIPIVYGESDYSRHVPRNSYINLKDFSSVEDLAKYILKVNADEDLYNSFLWWRSFYTVTAYPPFWCRLCQAMHDITKPAQVYSDLDGWFRNDTCQQFSLYNHISSHVEGYLLMFNIID